MKPRDLEHLRRWLDAERRDGQSEAESALRSLFAALPVAQPSAGFGDRVLANAARLGLLPAAPSRWAWFGRWFSASLLAAASLFLVVLGAQLRGPILRWLGEITWTDLSVALIASMGHLIAAAAAIWQGLLHSSESLSLNLQTPGTALTLIVALAMSTLAFRALRELLSPDRSSAYVQLH